jgi:hypothetical protein
MEALTFEQRVVIRARTGLPMQVLAPNSVRAVSLEVVPTLLRGRQRHRRVAVYVRKIAVLLRLVRAVPQLEIPARFRCKEYKSLPCR